jgi:ribose 5-phosphate isomerase A
MSDRGGSRAPTNDGPRRVERLKRTAAEAGAELVESGTVVGLGGGTTILYAVRRLAQRLHSGELHDVLCVSSSRATTDEALHLGLALTTLEQRLRVDLTIDGADEVDPRLDLIKGGGGALLREKILAQASAREVIIVDGGKLVERLGSSRPLPLEVATFGWRTQAVFLESLGARVTLRENPDRSPFLTEQGNLILDADFGPIDDPRALGDELERRAGIVEHGLFLGLADEVVVADAGGLRTLARQGDAPTPPS